MRVYVLIKMFQGSVDGVEVFMNKEDALASLKKYTGASLDGWINGNVPEDYRGTSIFISQLEKAKCGEETDSARSVTVSLKTLYERFGGKLTYGKIVKSEADGGEYYDLWTTSGLVCMDGETCHIIDVNEHEYKLISENEISNTSAFTLTKEEYLVGAFEC